MNVHSIIKDFMSPRTKEQFDRMRAKSREKIMEAALELFTQRGYHGTSISLIAERAGVSTGLMYNYFQSKVELLEAIVRRGMTLIETSMADIETIEEPRQKIAAMVNLTFDIAEKEMHFWSLYFSIIMQPDLPENARRIFSDFIQEMFGWLEAILKQLGYADPAAEARVLGAILDGACLHYWFVGKPYPLKQVKDAIIRKYCGVNH
jgi:AcrR family transcriptional regulator